MLTSHLRVYLPNGLDDLQQKKFLRISYFPYVWFLA
jgi:hypothetical protein